MDWKRDSSELRTIWPYPVMENVVKLEINARLQGCAIPPDDFQKKNWLPGAVAGLVDGKAAWDIYLLDVSWTDMVVQCSFTVDDPVALRKGVLPPDQDIPLSFALLLRCDSTRWRQAITCPFSNGTGSVEFSVSRADIAGALEAQPLVILSSAPTLATGSWATRKAAKVATGFPMYFHADEPLEGPGRGIKIQWERFDDSIADALYRLEIKEDQEVCLWLNNRRPAIQPVMDSKSKVKNAKNMLRDTLFSFIAGDVWLHLADAAANSELEEGDELPELYDKILRVLSRRLGIDREDIESSFSDDSDALDKAGLHTRLQNYLAVAEKVENIALTAPEKSTGGD